MEIELTRGKVALIDDDDFGLVCGYRWHASSHGKTPIWYATHSASPTEKLFMHNLILGEAPEGKIPDHKNGDGLDNRRENLRWATRQQNMRNRRVNKGIASGFKGVYPHGKKWRAAIQIEGSLKYLGLFISRISAAKAYDRAATKYFGQFAKVNF